MTARPRGLPARLAAVACLTFSTAAAEPAAPLRPAPGHALLLLDDRVVARAEDATLVLGPVEKHPANPLFGEDRPWEPRGDNFYANVLYDEEEQVYKCWYNPFVTSALEERTPRAERRHVPWQVSERMFGLCYATSADGLRWEKPDLGLTEFRGSKANNILLFRAHGPGIVKDPAADPACRYRMISAVDGLGPHRAWCSPDGLRWGTPTLCDTIGGRSDTRNNVLWIPERNEWMLISRVGFTPRDIGRSASRDFRVWSPIEQILAPGPDQPQFHDMVACRQAGLYLGLIGVFDTAAGRQWVELAWSPDSLAWHRIQPGVPFIPNAQREGDYDWGCIFADRPIDRGDEIRIYYSASNGRFLDWRDAFLCLATIRRDRWAGYRSAPGTTGRVTTQPLVCPGGRLTVNADARGGGLGVEVLDEAGGTLRDGPRVTGDVMAGVAADLDPLAGRTIRLRFALDGATLYGFSFAPRPAD